MSRDALTGQVRAFLREHFKHFNSGELVRAAEAYAMLIERGGSMMISLAGALSTAEIGIGLAEMIRHHKVHAICCTGANLEEDVFGLFTRDNYRPVPNYRELSARDECALHEQGLNRVTDTCIPEETIRVVGELLLPRWEKAASRIQRAFPHEYLTQMVLDPGIRSRLQRDSRNSWVHAAAEQSVPIFVPGWEDSTLGNLFTARVIDGTIPAGSVVRSGVEYLAELVEWYRSRARLGEVGLFQLGGGIAGDFAASVVPLIRQDLALDAPMWSYYCQVSDSTTSYGSYSGAVPNEKITWGKLGVNTPRFMIESDATIVAPLVFASVMGF